MVSSGQPGFHRNLNEWYDVSKFHLQGQYLLGNESHNALYGPNSQALALSGIKMFPDSREYQASVPSGELQPAQHAELHNPSTTIRAYTNGIGSSTADAAISSTRPSAIPRQLQLC